MKRRKLNLKKYLRKKNSQKTITPKNYFFKIGLQKKKEFQKNKMKHARNRKKKSQKIFTKINLFKNIIKRKFPKK